ncbi:hypothetical protein RF11_09636 [Thelohanellus kitauei]|uniref:ISXO2-like transposase domain-containing protein n=1 Tax=Thelohanellus kitauei TaxID=669202 RepID=A0A0C2JWB1_THEKT|nr:hypothetical protein RF11_09636 [Thelohanellus kitauei]
MVRVQQLSSSQNLKLFYFWASDHPGLQIANHRLSERLVIDYMYFIKEICLWKLSSLEERIGGPGIFVEIDECNLFKRKNHVFGAVKRNDIFREIMVIVVDRKRDTLLPIIQNHIEPGSIIKSNKWASYNGLEAAGYTHLTVCQRRNFRKFAQQECPYSDNRKPLKMG